MINSCDPDPTFFVLPVCCLLFQGAEMFIEKRAHISFPPSLFGLEGSGTLEKSR